MELKRRVGDCMSLILLLGSIATALAVSGDDNKTGQNLDCTNDSEKWNCQFEAQNCFEYNLTLKINDSHEERHCILKQWTVDTGLCCCSVKMVFVPGEIHTATVWNRSKIIESKNVTVINSFKPKTPTIISVNESNGNFVVRWKTNMLGYVSESLKACVTYHKKGDTEKVGLCGPFKPTTVDGLNYYEILGEHLEPSTTYVVSVKSHTNWSDRFSDSSEEREFTTPVSPKVLLLAVIISLSVAAVIISGAIYGCYVKLKTKWWDTFAKFPNPKLLIMHPSEQEVLKPMPPIISSICVEPLVPDDNKLWLKESLRDTSSGSLQQSSGISTGSSCLSYANTEPADIKAAVKDALDKAFANISPVSPLTTNPLTELNKDSGLFSDSYNPCGVRVDDINSGSSGFDNKTYSILIPSCQNEIMTHSSEVQKQTEILCDSAYHPSEVGIGICPNQQVPACLLDSPPVVSSLMTTDMSYQQCNADSGRFSSAEDSSLSSISSGTNTTASCDPMSRVESFNEVVIGATKLNGKAEEVIICDDNPCYSSVPAGLHSFPSVDDDYQAFQNLVEHPDLLFSEKRSVKDEEHLSKYPEESFMKMPQSFCGPVVLDSIDNIRGGQCLSQLQDLRPFPSLIFVDQSMQVITDSGYQSV